MARGLTRDKAEAAEAEISLLSVPNVSEDIKTLQRRLYQI